MAGSPLPRLGGDRKDWLYTWTLSQICKRHQQTFDVGFENWLDHMAIEASVYRRLFVALLAVAGYGNQADVVPLRSPCRRRGVRIDVRGLGIVRNPFGHRRKLPRPFLGVELRVGQDDEPIGLRLGLGGQNEDQDQQTEDTSFGGVILNTEACLCGEKRTRLPLEEAQVPLVDPLDERLSVLELDGQPKIPAVDGVVGLPAISHED